MRIRSVAIDSCLGVIASYTFHGLSCQDKLCHTSSQLVLLCHKESYSVTRSRATLVTGLPFGSFATKERRLSLSSPSPSLARFTIFFAYGDLSDLSHFDHLWTISQTSPLTQLWCISGPEFKLLPICLMATLDHHRFWKSKLAQAPKSSQDLIGPREFRNPSFEHPWPKFLPHPGSRLFQVAFVILR